MDIDQDFEIIDFEVKFAKLTNRKFAATVANGTAALEIAIKTLNLKKSLLKDLRIKMK